MFINMYVPLLNKQINTTINAPIEITFVANCTYDGFLAPHIDTEVLLNVDFRCIRADKADKVTSA